MTSSYRCGGVCMTNNDDGYTKKDMTRGEGGGVKKMPKVARYCHLMPTP